MSEGRRILPQLNQAVVRYADSVASLRLKQAGVEPHGYDAREYEAAANEMDDWLAQATRCMDAVVLAHLQTGDDLR